MIKKLVIIMNIVCIVSVVNCMEINGPEKKPTVVIDIPELNLGNLPQDQLTLSNGGQKTPISGVNEVSNLVRARSELLQKTVRKEELPVRNKTLVINEDDISSNNVKGLDELDLKQKVLDNVEETKNWKNLKLFNPTLYDFAQSHDMSFEDATIYADLLQQFHLAPEAIVELIKQTHKLGNHKPDDWEIKHYKDIQKTDPAKYEAVMLNFMKEVFDKADGKSQRSTIHSEHLAAQNNQIAGQNGFIQKLTVGNVVGAISTIIMAAWGIYGQISSSLPANQKNCTM